MENNNAICFNNWETTIEPAEQWNILCLLTQEEREREWERGWKGAKYDDDADLIPPMVCIHNAIDDVKWKQYLVFFYILIV